MISKLKLIIAYRNAIKFKTAAFVIIFVSIFYASFTIFLKNFNRKYIKILLNKVGVVSKLKLIL